MNDIETRFNLLEAKLSQQEKLIEANKKKKKQSGGYLAFTTGFPEHDDKMFNQAMGTDFPKDEENAKPGKPEDIIPEAGTNPAPEAADVGGVAGEAGASGSMGGESAGDAGASASGEGGAMGEALDQKESTDLKEAHFDPADYWNEDPYWYKHVSSGTKSADWDIINKARAQARRKGYTTYGTASKRNYFKQVSGPASTYKPTTEKTDSEKAKEAYKANLKDNKLDVKNFHAAYDEILEKAGYLKLFNAEGILHNKGTYGTIKDIKDFHAKNILMGFWRAQFNGSEIIYGNKAEEPKQEGLTEETKRYVKRYYIRPQNIFCSNKTEILRAFVDLGEENCSVYSLKSLSDHDDVQLLKPSDIIYYYDDGIIYDKNHVKVMDYDLSPKHEEERAKQDVNAVSDAAFAANYDDRLTDIETDSTIKVSENLSEDTIIFEETTCKDGYHIVCRQDKYAGFEVIGGPETQNGEYRDEIHKSFTSKNIALKAYYKIVGEHNASQSKGIIEEVDHLGLDFPAITESKLHEDEESCCICGEPINGYGNNAEPYKSGRCCDACNMKFVIPARLAELGYDED